MKRFGIGSIAAALLLVMLPMAISSCGVTCACTAPAPPGTPLPVLPEQAAVSAAKVAGVTGMTALRDGVLNWTPYYRASADNAIAYVDGVSGVVFEVVLVDQMPNDTTNTPPGPAAKVTAEAFMARAGLSTDGLTDSVTLRTIPGASAYDVTWKDRSGATASQYMVSVNPATGSVFSFLDLRLGRGLVGPIIGRSRASKLAIEGLGRPGEKVIEADFHIDFSSGTQVSAWSVGLGVPSGADPSVSENDGLVQVDAATGATTIVKS